MLNVLERVGGITQHSYLLILKEFLIIFYKNTDTFLWTDSECKSRNIQKEIMRFFLWQDSPPIMC